MKSKQTSHPQPIQIDDIDYERKIQDMFYSVRKIFYPIRPILTLTIGTSIIALGMLGVMPLAIAVWLGSTTLTDDLILYPALRLNRFRINLQIGLKRNKSIVGLVCTGLGYLLGGLAAYGILVYLPNVSELFSQIVIGMNCHLSTLAASEIIFAIVAHAMKKPAIFGLMIGGIIAPFLPISIPIAVDVYAICIISGGFVATYVSKQVMRGIFNWKYGDSNADGHFYSSDLTKISEQDKTQAKVFKVRPEVVMDLRATLLKAIKGVRSQCHYGHEVMGIRAQITNSFKDIFQLLMAAKDPQQQRYLLELLLISKAVAERELHFDTTGLSVINSIRQASKQGQTELVRDFETSQNPITFLKQDKSNQFEYYLANHRLSISSGFAKMRAATKGEYAHCHDEFSRTSEKFIQEYTLSHPITKSP